MSFKQLKLRKHILKKILWQEGRITEGKPDKTKIHHQKGAGTIVLMS